MTPSESVKAMWEAFSCAQPGLAGEGVACSAWHFCDNRTDADELAELVRAGTKRATAGALWTYEAGDEPLPQPGDLSVITDWDGRAVCVIRTVSVDIVPFAAVSPEFAAIEGEGDGSLKYWREGHLAFFARELAEIGRQPAPEMPVVCECFEVVYGSASSRVETMRPSNPSKKETAVQYEEFLEFVKGRRTHRAIKPDAIPQEVVDKLLEAARWAPTGFNMQPVELLVVKDPELRAGIKTIVDDYKNADFFALEATREDWQGSPWTIETHGRWDTPVAPVILAVLGDTRRRVGLPMAARYSRQKGDSIFEASLANAFMYIWLAAHSLGLAAQPVSGVKYPKIQGLVKQLLNLPDFIYVYDLLLIGYRAEEDGPSAKLTRQLDDMVHYDRAADDEFMEEVELRRQIVKLRAGNVARHVEAESNDT